MVCAGRNKKLEGPKRKRELFLECRVFKCCCNIVWASLCGSVAKNPPAVEESEETWA